MWQAQVQMQMQMPVQVAAAAAAAVATPPAAGVEVGMPAAVWRAKLQRMRRGLGLDWSRMKHVWTMGSSRC